MLWQVGCRVHASLTRSKAKALILLESIERLLIELVDTFALYDTLRDLVNLKAALRYLRLGWAVWIWRKHSFEQSCFFSFLALKSLSNLNLWRHTVSHHHILPTVVPSQALTVMRITPGRLFGFKLLLLLPLCWRIIVHDLNQSVVSFS